MAQYLFGINIESEESMTEYSMVSIDIRLFTDDMEDGHICFKQTIPVNVLSQNNPYWLKQIIAIINKLEVPNV